MFTLEDLMEQSTICGNVRLSYFDNNGDEQEIIEFHDVDNLYCEDIGKHMEREIAYIFSGNDGFLHIETENYDE